MNGTVLNLDSLNIRDESTCEAGTPDQHEIYWMQEEKRGAAFVKGKGWSLTEGKDVTIARW